MIVDAYGIGAALLALWAIARFPSFGPQRANGALVAMVVAAGMMSLSLSLLDPVAGSSRFGPLLALLFILLPALTAAFWAGACMLRALASLKR
jgi:hypothetical protein